MKGRLARVAVLATFALVAGPIASASAANHSELVGGATGGCWVEGEAEFTNVHVGPVKFSGLGFSLAEAEYSFAAGNIKKSKQLGAKANTCEGTAREYNEAGELQGAEETGTFEIVSAAVTGGHGELECGPASTDSKEDREFKGATATITVKKGGRTFAAAKSYFRFDSTGVAGEIKVELNSHEGGTGHEGKGYANFKEPTPASDVGKQCGKHEANKLSFETAAEKEFNEEPLLKEHLRVPGVGLEGTVGEK
jgi:hypothetical protein